jgi:hypothetical protein
MSAHKGKGDQSPAAKMFADKAIDSVAILEMIKQHREAIGLTVQRKHCLMHKCKSGAACFGQDSSLGDPILEYSQLHCFRSVSPEVVSDRIRMCLSCSKVRVHAPGFGFAVKTYICMKRKKITHGQQGAKQIKSSKDSHFIAFPRLSISSRRNFLASVAHEALERTTLTLEVTILSSCWVPLSWSRKERIKESSPREGARLSTAREELPMVSYEIGQASEPADEPCT